MLSVLVARHTADLGTPLFRLEEVLDEWSAPDVDLAQDAAVIEVDATIAAYAIVHRPGAYAVVAPAHERRGVGACLLALVEQHVSAQVRICLLTGCVDRIRMTLLHVEAGQHRGQRGPQLVRGIGHEGPFPA